VRRESITARVGTRDRLVQQVTSEPQGEQLCVLLVEAGSWTANPLVRATRRVPLTDLQTAIAYLHAYKQANPSATKDDLQSAYVNAFRPDRLCSVLVGRGYSLRFSEARGDGEAFSNTILSISALSHHDDRPFVVVVTRPGGVDFLLANSTFLRKISHSSRDFRSDSLRGSFNGSDILRQYDGLRNSRENFGDLFALHSEFTWKENVERLVEATNAIVPRDLRFRPTGTELTEILLAPDRTLGALRSQWYGRVVSELQSVVANQTDGILSAALIDNVNLRGNTIEQLITAGGDSHRLDDLRLDVPAGQLSIDIKTKLLDRASAPKAYNVDKMLAFLARPGTVAAFLLVGVDVARQRIECALVPILDDTLLQATRVQHHWAGRGSRGVTQLSGPFGRVFEPGYTPRVQSEEAQAFLEGLVLL